MFFLLLLILDDRFCGLDSECGKAANSYTLNEKDSGNHIAPQNAMHPVLPLGGLIVGVFIRSELAYAAVKRCKQASGRDRWSGG